MQNCLNEFVAWFSERGLTISAQKSYCLVITKGRQPINVPPLMLNGSPIPFVNSFKYLGVTIDSKLSWKYHIKSKLSKAKRDLLIARRLVDKNWGLSPDKALWIYTAIVRPSIDYACQVWFPTGVTPNWLIKELDKVQRLALVNASSCLPSTPTRALERLFNIAPLHLHLKQRALCIINRIYHSVNKYGWDGIGLQQKRGHLFKWTKQLGTGLTPTKRVTLLNLNHTEVNFREAPITSDYNVYTDGSKMGSNTGFGWAITKDNFVIGDGYHKLPGHSSVYEAELLAIKYADT